MKKGDEHGELSQNVHALHLIECCVFCWDPNLLVKPKPSYVLAEAQADEEPGKLTRHCMENSNKAVDILKECGVDGWVKKYEKELTVLS